MVFSLDDKISEEILQALENQNEFFVLDAENIKLVSASIARADDDRFYELPEWTSKNGFDLREDFVNQLNHPEAKRILKEVLHSGRGVFRNFKNELKQFPEIEKKWHVFKNNRMHAYIDEWYNRLREVWGLEKLDFVTEENDDLVHNDFSFKEYSSGDKELVLHFADKNGGFDCHWPEEIKDAAKELWFNQLKNDESENQTGFICSSLSDDFAGCILAAPVSERTQEVMILKCFFVLEKFRGLGIGSALLEMLLSRLKSLNKKWIILVNSIIPEELEPMLLRSGFEKTGSGYAARIL